VAGVLLAGYSGSQQMTSDDDDVSKQTLTVACINKLLAATVPQYTLPTIAKYTSRQSIHRETQGLGYGKNLG